MTKALTATICAIFLAGCASASESPDAPPNEPNATDEASLSDEATSALASCRRDIDRIEEKPRDERVAFAVEACRELWFRDACSSSFDEALALPSYQRAGHILRACRDDYCPTFADDVAQGLALCVAPLDDPVSLVQPLADPDGTDPLEAWRAFNDVIFGESYGTTSDRQLLSDFPSMLLQLVVVAPPPGESGG